MSQAAPTFSLAVYCGSRDGSEPAFLSAAEATGHWIGSHGGQLVYGGGNTGLMGCIARACQAAGGRVVGVMPQALVDREVANNNCDELIVVQTMHERKQQTHKSGHEKTARTRQKYMRIYANNKHAKK